MFDCNGVSLVQGNGHSPEVLANGRGPGESGVGVLRTRFRGGAFFSAMAPRHLIYFHLSQAADFRCSMADKACSHQVRRGSVVALPERVDWTASTNSDVDNLLICIDPETLSLAAAEEGGPGAKLTPWLRCDDPALWVLAQVLAAESAADYPNGALYWNDVAAYFIEGVLARHTLCPARPNRGALDQSVLRDLREYIDAHLHEPIDVTVLAGIAGRSPFHFSRVFTRSVGVTPHRYIVHLRVKSALELIRDGRHSLAEIAIQCGFSDQSHFSRAFKRATGATPGAWRRSWRT
jgi:AraC family transcriptional regulator